MNGQGRLHQKSLDFLYATFVNCVILFYSIVRAFFFLLLLLFFSLSLLILDLELTTMSMTDRHRTDKLAFTRNTWGMRLSQYN